jgi:hypothetical protein
MKTYDHQARARTARPSGTTLRAVAWEARVSSGDSPHSSHLGSPCSRRPDEPAPPSARGVTHHVFESSVAASAGQPLPAEQALHRLQGGAEHDQHVCARPRALHQLARWRLHATWCDTSDERGAGGPDLEVRTAARLPHHVRRASHPPHVWPHRVHPADRPAHLRSQVGVMGHHRWIDKPGVSFPRPEFLPLAQIAESGALGSSGGDSRQGRRTAALAGSTRWVGVGRPMDGRPRFARSHRAGWLRRRVVR